MSVVYDKEGTDLDNALNVTPRTSINGAAGSQAGCTTALVRPVPKEPEGTMLMRT
jgi:hypothetical protein